MDGTLVLQQNLSTAQTNDAWESVGGYARELQNPYSVRRAHLADINGRVTLMDEAGIERAELSQCSQWTAPIVHAAAVVTVGGNAIGVMRSDFIGRFPDPLSMFACLPRHAAGAAATTLDRAEIDLGAVDALADGDTDVSNANSVDLGELVNLTHASCWREVAEVTVPVHVRGGEPLAARQRLDIANDYLAPVQFRCGVALYTSTTVFVCSAAGGRKKARQLLAGSRRG